jgi:NAD(P)-dependent dehydrogenase (short-subunit alcohol dehydrogenase family)
MTTYLITGARGGIGSALARRVAGEGVLIGLVDSVADVELERVAESCRAAGAKVIVRRIDVCQGLDIADFIEELASSQGRLDVVLACAGEGSGAEEDGSSIDSARRLADVNYFGAINTFLPAAELMKGQGSGSLVSITSIGALVSTQNSAAYSASKAALRMWFESLRLRLWGTGVTLTDVVCGFVDTPMIAGLAHAQPLAIDPDRAAERILRAARKGTSVASIPLVQNLPWWVMRSLPNTARGYLLNRIWRRMNLAARQGQRVGTEIHDRRES